MQVSEMTGIVGKMVEYSREEKIEELKKRLKDCKCVKESIDNILYITNKTIIKDPSLIRTLDKRSKNYSLTMQSYELLLHKLEKGEAK